MQHVPQNVKLTSAELVTYFLTSVPKTPASPKPNSVPKTQLGNKATTVPSARIIPVTLFPSGADFTGALYKSKIET